MILTSLGETKRLVIISTFEIELLHAKNILGNINYIKCIFKKLFLQVKKKI